MHGSRILSRSFQVERWEGEDGTIDDNADGNTSVESGMDLANMSAGSGMDVDGSPADASQPDESDDEDAVDPSDVAMVPMADMLNARYGSENVGTFSIRRYLFAEITFRRNYFTKRACYAWSRRNQLRLVNK
jgi:N-lysine methyltransferase SETD6